MDGLTVEEISLTADACWNVLETAVEAGRHGIGDWAHTTKLERLGDNEMILALEDTEGQERTETGWTAPKRYRIHATQVRAAVLAILRDPHGTEALGAAERIMTLECPDGPTADAIIQVACFGKVIYG